MWFPYEMDMAFKEDRLQREKQEKINRENQKKINSLNALINNSAATNGEKQAARLALKRLES